MSLKKQLVLAVIITCLALLIWASPDARAQFGILTTIVQANGLLVLLLIAPVLLVLMAAIFVISSNARKSSRDLDEYMRAARQTKPITPEPDSSPVNAEEEANLPFVETARPKPIAGKPNLSVIAGGKSDVDRKATMAATARAESKIFTAQDLAYQAVINAETNDIIGYEVLVRQVSQKQTKPIYTRTPHASNAETSGLLEYQLINQALRSQRQIIAASDTPNARLFINVSPSLLSQKRIWAQFMGLLTAHRELASSMTIVFSDAHLILASDEDDDQVAAQRLSELRKMSQLGVHIGIRGVLKPISTLDGKLLRLMHVISFDVTQLCVEDFNESIRGIEAKSGIGAFDLYCTNLTSDADIVDALAGNITLISGDHIARPRALKTDVAKFGDIETSNAS